MVGERSCVSEKLRRKSRRKPNSGEKRRANAGMSSVMHVRTMHTESLRVPGRRQTTQGEPGPKLRPIRRKRWTSGKKSRAGNIK